MGSIPKRVRCNGIYDCLDRSDESGCSNFPIDDHKAVVVASVVNNNDAIMANANEAMDKKEVVEDGSFTLVGPRRGLTRVEHLTLKGVFSTLTTLIWLRRKCFSELGW